MKKRNTFATNAGGIINAPSKPAGIKPKSVAVKGNDLRTPKGK